MEADRGDHPVHDICRTRGGVAPCVEPDGPVHGEGAWTCSGASGGRGGSERAHRDRAGLDSACVQRGAAAGRDRNRRARGLSPRPACLAARRLGPRSRSAFSLRPEDARLGLWRGPREPRAGRVSGLPQRPARPVAQSPESWKGGSDRSDSASASISIGERSIHHAGATGVTVHRAVLRLVDRRRPPDLGCCWGRCVPRHEDATRPT